MNKPLGIGVVGLGSIANHHIKSVLEIADARLVAVSSSDGKKRKDAEETYGVKALADYRQMVRLPEVDIVIICTPSGFHLEPALAAANAGKHVVVEKPLEITADRTRQIIAACEKGGAKLACIFQNRFSEDFQKVFQAVQAGDLGRLVLGNAYIKWFRSQEYYDSASWRGTKMGDGGAALINQSIHTIDLLLHVMGPVKSVSGMVKTLTHKIEGEDVGVGNIEFENGALGTIEGSTSIFQGFPERLEIHGEEGSIIMEGGKIIYWNTKSTGKLDFFKAENQSATGSSDPMAISHRLHIKQLEAIFDAIKKGDTPPVSGEDAIKPIQVIEAVYRSSATGQKVRI